MKRTKKNIILLCVRITILLSLIFGILVGGYVYVVVSELKLKIEETKVIKSKSILSKSNLESDTRVYKTQLENYLIYSKNGESSEFLKNLISSNKIETSKQLIFINDPLELPAIEENDCQRFKCIQIKKRFTQIPSSIWKGLLGTEDFRFLEHRGIDPIAIARAIIVDVIAMKFIQGGSTLTQQLVKNLFLTNEKKLSRKLKEMVYAIYIENVMDKEQIITLYLNEVFWGTYQGIYLKGFHAASIAYFNKAPNYLSEYEATILVSLLKGPNYYRPSKKINRLRDRSSAVFKRLQSLNLVTDSERVLWSKARWLSFQKDFIKRDKANSFYSYYLLTKNRETNLEPFEKFVLYNAISKTKNRIKARTGKADIGIKAIIANKECESFDCEDLFSYYSKPEREKRKAIVDEYHQVGSLLKPIVYDTFIELGRGYDEEISRAEITLKLKSGSWTPKDYSKAKEKTITLKRALQKSKNIPLIRVASEIGFDVLEKKLEKRIPRLQKPLSEYPAQLLGALELSLEEVFKTYNLFIKDKCQNIKENELRMEDTILYYMSVASETTISRLAKQPLKNAYIFGKTGTTNNGLDNWYFAFDGREVYVFWFGVDSERNKHDLKISGASTAFMIFQDFINHRGKLISEILCE